METTMANNDSSQEQHPMFPGFDTWQSVMSAHTERFEKVVGEMERLERERQERALLAIDQLGALMKSTLEYQNELATAWRRIGLEATKKV
jgi:hypothetical protein